MKKKLFSLVALLYFAFCFTANAQTPACSLKAKFEYKADKCTLSFIDLSAAATGTTLTNWHWDFGDATTSTLQNPTHTYTTAGTYTVCLTAVGKNANGEECKDQFCLPVTVEGCGQDPCGVKPLFEFKIDKCTVYFVDQTGTNSGTTITSWLWDFGDATTSNIQNPSHTYTSAGTYTVCLTAYAKNAAGVECKNTYCTKVTVDGCGQTEPCKVAAKFEFKVDKCTVSFYDASAVGVGSTITSWLWDFGDATSSTLQNPSHTYATAGTYNVCLTVYAKNAAGVECKNTYCTKVTVEGCGQTEPCKVAAKFSYKIYKCTTYFTDFSAAAAGTTITSWLWDFGDGNTSTLQNPTHVYTTPGTYLVCLVVVGKNSATGEECKDKYCEEIRVIECGQAEPCKVTGKFDYKKDGCTVYFADLSATAPGTVITYWEWNFGDGNILTGVQNPSHTYVAAGTYEVCLIIVGKNADGVECKDKICMKVKVGPCNKKFALENASVSELQIYPNPAHGDVYINFSLNVASQVNISITDIQGRVLDVIQGGQMVAGEHNLNWNVNVRSGLYLITIKTDAGVEQRQVVINE